MVGVTLMFVDRYSFGYFIGNEIYGINRQINKEKVKIFKKIIILMMFI